MGILLKETPNAGDTTFHLISRLFPYTMLLNVCGLLHENSLIATALKTKDYQDKIPMQSAILAGNQANCIALYGYATSSYSREELQETIALAKNAKQFDLAIFLANKHPDLKSHGRVSCAALRVIG